MQAIFALAWAILSHFQRRSRCYLYTVTKVYFPDDPPIQIHQLRAKNCPISFPCGYYWYGKKRFLPGRPPKWVEKLMKQPPSIPGSKSNEAMNTQKEHERGKELPQPAKKTEHKVVTRRPYNLRRRPQQDTNIYSLRTSSRVGGDM